MAGVAKFVSARQSHSSTPQPQHVDETKAPSQKLSRLEIAQQAKVHPPPTRLRSVDPQRSPTNQSSDDYNTIPDANEQQATERQIKQEHQEDLYGSPGAFFETDLEAAEDLTSEVQVGDSQTGTSSAQQRHRNFSDGRRNELEPEEQWGYGQDHGTPQVHGEEDPEEDESQGEDGDENDSKESGSSSTSARGDDVVNDESEQGIRGAQETVYIHAEDEVVKHLAPTHGRLSSAPDNERHLTQAQALTYLAERQLPRSRNGMASSHASYPSTSYGEPEDEAQLFKPKQAHPGPHQRGQQLRTRTSDLQGLAKQHQQPKPSSRSKQGRQQQPPRSHPATDAHPDFRHPPEKRQRSHVNQQVQVAPRQTLLPLENVPGSHAELQGVRGVNALRGDDPTRGQFSNGRQQNSYPTNSPSVSPEPPGSEHRPSLELDYDAEQLSKMDYATLREQPFDLDPRAASNTLTSNERPVSLPDQFKNFLSSDRKKQSSLQNPEKQRQFISTLNIEQWEAFGDLIGGGFSDILNRMKVVRQEKRKTAMAFEQEIAEREKLVRVKTGGVDELLNDMKKGGQGVLKGIKG